VARVVERLQSAQARQRSPGQLETRQTDERGGLPAQAVTRAVFYTTPPARRYFVGWWRWDFGHRLPLFGQSFYALMPAIAGMG